jgi:hypothetical protein
MSRRGHAQHDGDERGHVAVCAGVGGVVTSARVPAAAMRSRHPWGRPSRDWPSSMALRVPPWASAARRRAVAEGCAARAHAGCAGAVRPTSAAARGAGHPSLPARTLDRVERGGMFMAAEALACRRVRHRRGLRDAGGAACASAAHTPGHTRVLLALATGPGHARAGPDAHLTRACPLLRPTGNAPLENAPRIPHTSRHIPAQGRRRVPRSHPARRAVPLAAVAASRGAPRRCRPLQADSE